MTKSPFGTAEDWEKFFGLPKRKSNDDRSHEETEDVYTVRYAGLFETRVYASGKNEAIRKASKSDRWKRIGDLPVMNLEVR